MSGSEFDQGWNSLFTDLLRIGTPRVKSASERWRKQVWRKAFDRLEFARVEIYYRCQKTLSVRMDRMREDIVYRAQFYKLSCIEHRYAVAYLCNDSKIMSD